MRILRVALLLVCAIPATLFAQTGSVNGRVRSSSTGAALDLVSVELRRINGTVAGRATTDQDGHFRAANLAPATYTLVASRRNHAVATRTVAVRAETAVTVDLSLERKRTILGPTAVTAGRSEEKTLNAPGSISIVSTEEILEQPVTAFSDHLRGFPGADVAGGGLLQVNVVGRGFSNVFSGAMLTLVDSRNASVPSLKVNALYLLPIISEDVERIELLLGPAAVLYGPNAADGVLHIITKSPFESQEGTLTVESGERQFFRGAFRKAFTMGDRWAAKVSAEWISAHDWEAVDTMEANLIAQRPGAQQREYDLGRIAGEARIGFRPGTTSELTATYGRATVNSILEPTATSGAAFANGWNYEAFKVNGRWNNLFAQVHLNRTDAGNTVLLRSGLPIVDRSSEFATQLQHGFDLFRDKTTTTPTSLLHVIYGADFVRTHPVTDSTINGRFEEQDIVNEVGAYVHTVTRLTKAIDVVAAGRLDRNSQLVEPVFSPRAAVVLKPSPEQNIRFSYSGAFGTPPNFDFFLDQIVQTLPGVPYQVHAMGVPESGFQFRRDCPGGAGNFCMRSPFTPTSAGGAEQWIAASATPYWQNAIDIVLADPDAAGLLPLEGIFRSLTPGPADVASGLKQLNIGPGEFQPVPVDLVRDIPRLRPTLSKVFEIGYKGLWDPFEIGVNLWYSTRRDFISAARAETPGVFLDSASLAVYLEAQLSARGVPNAAQTAALAANAFASVPLGMVQMDHPFVSPSDVVLTFRNYGHISNSGLDVVAEYLLSDKLSVAGTYSHVTRNFFSREHTGSANELTLNGPRHKGTFSLRYRNEASSLSAELRGRFVGAFDVRSGVYDEHIRSYALADARLAMRSTIARGFVLSLSASNLLDNKHHEFAGGAALGRLIMTRIQFSF